MSAELNLWCWNRALLSSFTCASTAVAAQHAAPSIRTIMNSTVPFFLFSNSNTCMSSSSTDIHPFVFRVKSQYQGSHNTRTWQQDHHEASHLYGWHLEGKSRPRGTHSATPGLLLQAPLHIYIPCSSSVTKSISAQSAHLSYGSPLHVLRTSQTE